MTRPFKRLLLEVDILEKKTGLGYVLEGLLLKVSDGQTDYVGMSKSREYQRSGDPVRWTDGSSREQRWLGGHVS